MADRPDHNISSAYKAGRQTLQRAGPLPYLIIGLALMTKGILTHRVSSGVIGFVVCVFLYPILHHFYHRSN
ncbi:MAG TPA: hypothetical protein VKV39_14060 [Candidatus Sulfotelmatobacter sp.]|nr:hypothetical protein [Candidatus Sulfotelmatobacter sp.]